VNVAFDNGTGTAYGELVLGHAADFSGQISGFTGTAPDTTHSDAIDLKDVSFSSNVTFAFDDNAGTDTGGTLTIFDTGNSVGHISFANGDYETASFALSSNGAGGTLITDPPTSTTAAATASSFDGASTPTSGLNGNNTITSSGVGDPLTGGDGHDTFVFNAVTATGAGGAHFDTINDFTHNSDHIDFAAISGLNTGVQGVAFNSLTAAPGSIAAHTIDIVTSGGNTFVYANSTGVSESLVTASMEIHLTGVTNVTSSDFILHH
jgi:Peptidase M10 serralysin C terminal